MSSDSTRAKLLVVDDQPLNIRMLHAVLSPEYQVFMATSGEQALALCHANPPDLVLLDVVMPGMDGYETCRQLRADPRTASIPVVFVTGHDDDAERARGQAAGAAGFLSKPVEPPQVLALLESLLGR